MNDKTICIFSAFYLPNMGGVENFTHNIARELHGDFGLKVIIVTSALDNNDIGLTEKDGISILRLPSRLLLNKRFSAPRKNAIWHKWMNWLSDQSIDHILVNQRFYPFSIMGIDFAQKHNIPVLVMDHGSSHLTMSNPFIDIPIHLYEHAITRLVKKRKPSYCAVSRASAEWLHHFGITSSGIVNNAIDAAEFNAIASSKDFYNELNIPSSAFTLAFTGRLVAEKGILELCDVINELNSEGYSDIHLLIAGDGSLRKRIERSTNRNIHYLDRLNKEDVSALLQQCDVFCLPTISEGFSTSMLEAAASNMGVIVTNTGGAEELIPSSNYGIVLENTKTNTIKQAILSFYTNADYLQSASTNINEHVRRGFNWHESAKSLIKTFESI